jgi:hypothetical protein
MPDHSNEQIKKTILSSEELVKRMDALKASMVKGLNTGFEDLMGEKIPTMRQAKIRQVDTVMEYTSELKMDHFLKAVLGLATAAFSGDAAVIIPKAMAVAGVALDQIFGSVGLSTEVKGDSAILTHDDKEYLTAMYAVTQVCSAKQWFTETDFVVSSYVYFVTRPLDEITPHPAALVSTWQPRDHAGEFKRPLLRL